MKVKKIKIEIPKIGSWYQDDCAIHAYLIIGTKFNNKELKSVKCAYFLDLQNSGSVTLDIKQFCKFRKLKIGNIHYLEPIDNKSYLEMRNVLNSIKTKYE